MKNAWKEKRLAEITTKIGSGATPLGGEKAYKSEGVSLIRSLNVHDLGFRMKDLAFLDDKQADKLSNVTIESGDVLLNITGASVARCCIVPDDILPARVNQHVSIIRPIRSEILPEFLHYALISQVYKDRLLKTGEKGGATRQALTKAQIEEFSVSYPSIAEQQRIVSLIDEAFMSIAQAKVKAERNLINARELFESYSQKVIESAKEKGSLYSLGEYLDLITYGFTNPMPTTNSGPYMATAKNIKGGVVDYGTSRRTSQEAFDNLITDKSRPKKGDVLLTKDGTLGRLAVVEHANLCINQSVALLRPKSQLNSYYLKELLSSQFYQRLMIEQAGGTTIKHIYITRVNKMEIPVPSLAEQRVIVAKLNSFRAETKRLEGIYRCKVEGLDELKKSLLEQTFVGKS